MALWRRSVIGLVLALFLAPPSRAETFETGGDQPRYLRVGTGPPGETHFLLGSQLASAISAPPGLPACGSGPSCGVEGLIAVATATSGSSEIIEEIAEGRLDAGLTEADLPFWAASGAPPFAGHAITSLRAVANVGADQLHLVVRQDGPIHAMRDLRGKHISIGDPGSGTQLHASLLLAALGIKPKDIKTEGFRSAVAADAMLAGRLDGFFVMDSAPVPSVEGLAKILPIRLIGITGPAVTKLKREDPLIFPSRINGGTYHGVDNDAPTIAIGVTFLVSAHLGEELIYGITQSLWQDSTLKLLNDSHRGAPPIGIGSALSGLGLALHPGAQRFYSERGSLP